jgi:NAD(P)-dependent dehydrogenase (short-subunit alcohol dehydrogenase family)
VADSVALVSLAWFINSEELVKLQARRVIVTGGAVGIGHGIVLALLDAGAQVIVHDSNAAALGELEAEARSANHSVVTACVNVADAQSVRDEVDKEWANGPIDIVVNNAGVTIYKDPFDFSDSEWNRIMSVNVGGVWNYSQSVGRHMAERGGGVIINIASVASILASYRRAPYIASKGAVAMLTRALALDLAERNIRVNAVGPGPVSGTGMTTDPGGVQNDAAVAYTPMRRSATPRDIGNAVVFLASDDAAMITGQLLLVDGGISAGTQIGSTWSSVL